jgi:subtilisin family serine protease
MGSRNTIPNRDGILRRGSGTSFSGPLVAGLVACLKGAHPNKTNAQVFDAILISCDRYGIPDNEYGHGIPDALRADSVLTEMPVLGVAELNPLEALVYPNPARDYFQIRTEPGAELQITNLQGQVVIAKKLQNWVNFVNVKDLSRGTYVVRVMYEGSVGVRKVVVE